MRQGAHQCYNLLERLMEVEDILGKMKVNSKVIIDIFWFAIGSAGLGIVIGTIASSAQKIQNGKLSPIPYQNFGIYAGAIAGLSICLAVFVCYLVLTRFILHRQWFSLNLYVLFCVLASAVISLVTSYWVVTSAGSFGMAERTIRGVVTDSLISAVVGGGMGLLFGVTLAKLRHYEDF